MVIIPSSFFFILLHQLDKSFFNSNRIDLTFYSRHLVNIWCTVIHTNTSNTFHKNTACKIHNLTTFYIIWLYSTLYNTALIVCDHNVTNKENTFLTFLLGPTLNFISIFFFWRNPNWLTKYWTLHRFFKNNRNFTEDPLEEKYLCLHSLIVHHIEKNYDLNKTNTLSQIPYLRCCKSSEARIVLFILSKFQNNL